MNRQEGTTIINEYKGKDENFTLYAYEQFTRGLFLFFSREDEKRRKVAKQARRVLWQCRMPAFAYVRENE